MSRASTMSDINALSTSLKRGHFVLAPLAQLVKDRRWWNQWTNASGAVKHYHTISQWCLDTLSCEWGTALAWIAAYNALRIRSYRLQPNGGPYLRVVGMGYTRVNLMHRLARGDRTHLDRLVAQNPSTKELETQLGIRPRQPNVISSSAIHLVQRQRQRGGVDYLAVGRRFVAAIWQARVFPSAGSARAFVQSWRRAGRSGNLLAVTITIEIRPAV